MEQKRILLVEDNPDDVELTMMAFEKSGLSTEVAVVHDGIEALEYLHGTGEFAERGSIGMPEIILLDLKMPRMDGLEFLRRLRADDKTRMVPVVVLTTSNEDRDRIESYRLGANSYVRKPVEFHRFSDAVRQLGLYWLLLNEAPPKHP